MLQATSGPVASDQKAAAGGRVPKWVVALIAVAVIVVLAVGLGIGLPLYLYNRDQSREAAVRSAVRAIQNGIHGLVLRDNGALPQPQDVTSTTLRAYVAKWPANPYTGRPMRQGKAPGDHGYSVANGQFRLTGYGNNGRVVIVVP
jgi:type II secretory pathway pseudopilin PulG